MAQHGDVIELAKPVGHVEIAAVQAQCFFYLARNLIPDTFRRVLSSERADLRGGFTQEVGNVREAEFFLGQDASEILQASVGYFHWLMMYGLTFVVNALLGIAIGNPDG